MKRLIAADLCWGGALLTLPLAGVGLVHLLLERDLGTGVQPAYLLLGLAWLLRLADGVRPASSRERQRLRDDPTARGALRWGGVVVAVLGLSALGLVLAPAPLLAQEAWPRYLRQVTQVAVVAAFAVYPALWTRGPRRWRWTLRLLAVAAAGQVIYAVLQGVHVWRPLPGLDLLETVATSSPGLLAGSERLYLGGYTVMPRLRGTMLEPLYLGSFLLLVVPWLLVARRRVLAALATAVLVLTWSRAAWLAAAGGVVIWWLLRRRARLPGPSAALGWGLAGAAGLALGATVLAAGPEALVWPVRRLLQVADPGDWSNLTRYYSLQAAWRAFLESPLVGVGWGQYPYHFYAVVDLPGLESQFTWPVVNSLPVRVVCETGLAGLGAMVGGVVLLVRRTWQALGRTLPRARRMRLVAAAVAGGAVALQLAMFSQYNLPHPWVALGLWIAALAEARRDVRAPGPERTS